VLLKYLERGVDELGEEQLPVLLNLKYHTPTDALQVLGEA
jgi:hypothetical protein